MITIKNERRSSWQIDADFSWVIGLDPWPRYFGKQELLLKSDKLSDEEKRRLQNWIEGKDDFLPGIPFNGSIV